MIVRESVDKRVGMDVGEKSSCGMEPEQALEDQQVQFQGKVIDAAHCR